MTIVSNAEFDSYQIINKVLKLYKYETKTLVVARSALTANLTVEAYAQTSKEKIAQGVPGYEFIKDGTATFTCGNDKIQ